METRWSPSDYAKFKTDRQRPFQDLLTLIQPALRPKLLDIGCGDGNLTRLAHQTLDCSYTLGLDNSQDMLATTSAELSTQFQLQQANLPDELPLQKFDIVMSNSALNWMADHATLIPRLWSLVAPQGQLAFQVPWNVNHPSYLVALSLAESQAFRAKLQFVYRSPVLSPAEYAERIARLQPAELKTQMHIYPQVHGVDGIVEFAMGGLLSAYRSQLSKADFESFVASYHKELETSLGSEPLFVPFTRILVWAKKQ
jgi:trans-aconitate 2-methyltransferase